jgi:hypothetical protein
MTRTDLSEIARGIPFCRHLVGYGLSRCHRVLVTNGVKTKKYVRRRVAVIGAGHHGRWESFDSEKIKPRAASPSRGRSTRVA